MSEEFNIRHARIVDIDAITAVEAACFPAAEAATREEFEGRSQYYGEHFWLLYEGDQLISFVDGFVTDEADLTDEMYERAEMHDERKGLVLTCKDRLVHYYACFGFVDEGISDSTHGNVEWHQMRLTFGD